MAGSGLERSEPSLLRAKRVHDPRHAHLGQQNDIDRSHQFEQVPLDDPVMFRDIPRQRRG